MAGSRTVTAQTLAQAGAGVSAPMYFLKINWLTATTRICSYGPQNWNGEVWDGGGFTVRQFGQDSKPQGISLVDNTGAYRTLVLSDGIRDRLVQLWKGYLGALAASDPILLFKGYADGCEVNNGVVSFNLDWQNSTRQFSPRQRIGPSIGVNFCATPNTTLRWGGAVIKIEAR
jgi:hypothetical protein